MKSYKKIIQTLIKLNISISIAESCTGGLLCSSFTSKAGISQIFNMGLITYSNKSKVKLLKIKNEYINKYGAVSKEVAKMMVKNLKKISKSNLCISTTGIAGPTGASKNKPLGLVFIGISYKNKIIILKKNFTGSRNQIQKKTVDYVFLYINKLI